MAADATARAWAWVEHLLAGGTVPWTDFHDAGAPGRGALPGAAQLEVARRLNGCAGAPSADLTALVEHVLATSGPGRGRPDLTLVGVPASEFGAPPVDPARLPGSELVRITVGVLADLLARCPVSAAKPPPRATARPWHRDYQLTGDPYLADVVRASLLAAGHVPGLRSPVSLVLADDFATMLSDLWSWRILRGGTVRWARWLDDWKRQDAVPPRLDLVRMANAQSDVAGAEQVHVVVPPAPGEVARLVGAPDGAVGEMTRLSPEAVELVRQTNLVLRVLVKGPGRRQLLDETLVPLLADRSGGPRVVLPRHHDWVRRRAGRMRDELRVAGYPVLGDLDALVPGEALPGTRPTSAGVLDVALRTLLRFKEKAL